jgi:hypothetical protein
VNMILRRISHIQNVAKKPGSGNRAKYCLDFHVGHPGRCLELVQLEHSNPTQDIVS